MTGITAAAWDDTGERLAVATSAGEVRVVGRDHAAAAWPHLGVRTVAWSPDGRLASAGRDAVLVGDPGAPLSVEHIVPDAPVGHIALLGSRYLITTHGTEVAQWDLTLTGSELPGDHGPVALRGGNAVTASRPRTAD